MIAPLSLRLRLLVVCLVPFLLTTTGCSKDTQTKATRTADKTVADYFSIAIGTEKARLQFALSPLEQKQGLMHRRDLGPSDGMIFIYDKPQVLSFWMRNCPTALDIGFFDADGILQEVRPMLPYDESSVRSKKATKFAIEMPQGWYKGHNVQPGSRLDLRAVALAIEARGLSTRQYGLARP